MQLLSDPTLHAGLTYTRNIITQTYTHTSNVSDFAEVGGSFGNGRHRAQILVCCIIKKLARH